MGNRIAKNPVTIPAGVEITINDREITAKGKNGQSSFTVHEAVNFEFADNQIQFAPTDHPKAEALAGTMRTMVNNLVIGVSEGFKKELKLIGVGYRAAVQGDVVDLTVGLSHPVKIKMPEGVTIAAPSQTDLVISGRDKQAVGQIAADIRAVRPPEPYKGKGIRYADEVVILKEVKKK